MTSHANYSLRAVAVLIAAMFLLFGVAARCNDAGPNVTQIAHSAARIARVEIVRRSPVSALGIVGGKEVGVEVCGYYYEAKVKEALKGGVGTFAFFSAVDSDFRGFDRDYLVFVYQRSPDQVAKVGKSLEGLLTQDERTRIRCRGFGELYVPLYPQLMLSFESGESPLGGGAWLRPSTRAPLVWCELRVGQSASALVLRRKEPDGKLSMLEWDGLAKVIRRALSANFWELDKPPLC